MGDRRDPGETGPAPAGPPPWRDPRPAPGTGAVGVIVHDARGRVVSASGRALELLGVSLDQLRAPLPRSPVWAIVDPDGDPADPAELPPWAVVRAGRPTPGGLVGLDDGSTQGRRWLRIDSDTAPGTGTILTTVADATAEHRGVLVRAAARAVTARAIAKPTDVDGLVEVIVAEVGRACSATRSLLVDLDRAAGRAVPTHHWSPVGERWPNADRGAPIDVLARFLRHLSQGQPVTVTDLRDLVGPAMVRERLDVWGVRSGVAAPVIVAGRLEGFLAVCWDRARDCAPEWSDLLMLAADVLAAAMTAQLADLEVAHLRRRAEEDARAQEVTIGARRAELYDDVTPDLLLEIDAANLLLEVTSPGDFTSRVLDSLTGTDVLDVFHGAQRERLAEVLRAVRAGSPLEVFDFSWQSEGRERCFEARFAGRTGGRVVCVIREVTGAVARDRAVYERTHMLAMANEELTRLVHERDQFLASVSHELRTPLNAILGLTEMLVDGSDDPLTTGQASTLRTIESSGRHLLELINDLLDLSRLRARVLSLDLREVPVDEPCRLVLDLVRPRAAARGVRVGLVNDTGPLTVRADERRLRQVLINLLDNAVKFTEPGGSAGLQVWQPDADHVCLSVWDTGAGIAAGDHTRIFEPFAQIGGRRRDRADRRSGGEWKEYVGSGLGLSVVERLVSLHEGTIEVDSAPGRGSRFTVILPLAGPDADTAELPQIPDVDG